MKVLWPAWQHSKDKAGNDCVKTLTLCLPRREGFGVIGIHPACEPAPAVPALWGVEEVLTRDHHTAHGRGRSDP